MEDFAEFLAHEIEGRDLAGTTTTIFGDTPCTLWSMAEVYARLHGRRIMPLPTAGLTWFIPRRVLSQSLTLVQFLDIDRAPIPPEGPHVLLPFRWPIADIAKA